MKAVVYDDFLDRLLSTYCTEGLISLSVRWMQPIQQQGRRTPSLSSAHTLSTCWLLVSGFLTEIVQHIHSLRASGVRSSQAASAVASAARALRRSSGSSCTTPPEISFAAAVMYLCYYYNKITLSRKGCGGCRPPRAGSPTARPSARCWGLFGDVAVLPCCAFHRIAAWVAAVRIGSGWTGPLDWSSVHAARRRA